MIAPSSLSKPLPLRSLLSLALHFNCCYIRSVLIIGTCSFCPFSVGQQRRAHHVWKQNHHHSDEVFLIKHQRFFINYMYICQHKTAYGQCRPSMVPRMVIKLRIHKPHAMMYGNFVLTSGKYFHELKNRSRGVYWGQSWRVKKCGNGIIVAAMHT